MVSPAVAQAWVHAALTGVVRRRGASRAWGAREETGEGIRA